MGGGSALGRNSANPEHEFDENTDMPPFPGYENKALGKDFEWSSPNSVESNKGSWFNKKTGESFHWDMDHPDPIGIILGAILIMNTEYFLIIPGAKNYFK